MKYTLLIGRLLFSLLFVFSCTGNISGQTVPYAMAAGVPWPAILVPLAGTIQLLGGLSILAGFRGRIGGWLLVIFLLPVTLYMHAFWRVSDPTQHMMEIVNFMKNLSLLGAALLVTWFGPGPLSVDEALAKRNKA